MQLANVLCYLYFNFIIILLIIFISFMYWIICLQISILWITVTYLTKNIKLLSISCQCPAHYLHESCTCACMGFCASEVSEYIEPQGRWCCISVCLQLKSVEVMVVIVICKPFGDTDGRWKTEHGYLHETFLVGNRNLPAQ